MTDFIPIESSGVMQSCRESNYEDFLDTDADEQVDTAPSRSLYISHFLSTWNSRGFEFGSVLFLATIYPGTLMPLSIYALIRAAAAITLSPGVGRFIDSADRLQTLRISIVGQRLAVILSCLAFLALLCGLGSSVTYLFLTILVVLACVEKLCFIMNTVAVERDWIVVIAGGREKVLQEMNSQMRTIDLFCKLVSPLSLALLDGISSKVAILFTLATNAAVVGFEYFLIARVYQKTPALERQQSFPSSASAVEMQTLAGSGNTTENPKDQTYFTMITTLSHYVTSNAFLPSMSLAILYLTVLSFGSQMSTFLLAAPQPRMTSTMVGLLRTISTIVELSSTLVTPRLMSYFGPIRAGMWCISWQMFCLTGGVGLYWASGIIDITASVSIVALIVSVILSRAGLWSFDLIAQFHIQNLVESPQRGSFSSVEASVQNCFELCTFATTIIWAKPEQFRYPALISLGATYAAAVLYAKFVRDQRGHLLHMSSCLNIGRRTDYARLETTRLGDSVELDER